MLKECTLEFLKVACSLGNFDDSDHFGYACSNCKKYLMGNGKLAHLLLAYKELQFPEIPSELADLTSL